MLADLPPSSCATRLTVSAAAFATATPARVEPVNDIMSMPGCDDIAAPTVGPSPLTRLKTPAGTPASWSTSAISIAFSGAISRRLQHHRAAGRERGRDLAHDLVHRPVPRRDHADDADRLADDAGRALGFRELEVLEDLDRLRRGARRRWRLAPPSTATSARPFRARSSRRFRRSGADRRRESSGAAPAALPSSSARRSRTRGARPSRPCRRRPSSPG